MLRTKYTVRPIKPGRQINRWWWLLPLIWIAASCNKSQEPPRPVGQVIAFTGAPNRTLKQLLDSIPNLTIYDSIYRHSDLGHILDSLRSAGAGGLNTLFAPTDQAFQSAGISLGQVGGLSPAVLDSIVFYLATPGSYSTQAVSALQGGLILNSFLTDPAMKRTYRNPGYSSYSPYIYHLILGWADGSLLLNGVKVRTSGAQGLPATDGVLWELDTLVRKPFLEAYQVIASDTSFSLFLTACRISDKLYGVNGEYQYRNIDTIRLQVEQKNNYITRGLWTFFVPTNDAFRKAGFQSPADISAFVDTSQCAIQGGYDQNGNQMLTNMDSILNFNQTPGAFYTTDILTDPSLSGYLVNTSGSGQSQIYPTYFGVSFSNVGGRVVMHRQDFPNGRAATVIAPYDITTLNGIVHTVDNLLMPQP